MTLKQFITLKLCKKNITKNLVISEVVLKLQKCVAC